ncbi:hypothetical protein [Amycolatopsis thailandensis]|uniref:hypothetical protein n=1 Tax=Amycolatopsis thailandensis TaxID=589330 RepID=UPI00362895EF
MNGWIGSLFDQQNIEQTVTRLVGAQPAVRAEGDGVASKQLEEAEAKLRRFQDAIAAGVDPMALVESINEAQADRAAAQGALAVAGEPAGITDAEVYAMIDSLGDIRAALADSQPGKLARLYRDLRLDLRYNNEKEAVYATTSLRVNNAGVRGGT